MLRAHERVSHGQVGIDGVGDVDEGALRRAVGADHRTLAADERARRVGEIRERLKLHGP